MTAYKYVARDAESRVNWGDISKTWSDAILKVEEDREAKRQTIKTETDELANKLIEAPRGQHQGANEWTAGYADMQQQALLDRYRQLTSGNLSVRDWNSSLANAKQSTEQMFNLSKVYQEEYASIMERDQNMDSQEAELALAAEFEGFTNFTDTVPLVDPVTLSAKIGRQVYDPETGTYKVGETITMNGMYNLLKGRYNRFDIQAAAAEDVKTLGKYTTVVMDGQVKTRENWQDDPLYNKELDAKIDVHFSDPQNITSVLTNAMDSGYSTTGLLENALDREGNVDDKKVFWVTNPAQASAGAKTPLISLDIELDKNGNIVGRSEAELDNIFGENVSDEERSALVRAANDQREQAREFMRTYYTAEVDLIETPMAERTSKTTAGERGLAAQGKVNLRALEKIHGGDDKDAQEGLEHVFGKDPSYRTSRVKGSGDSRKVIVEYYDKAEKRSYTREFNIPVGLKEWIDVGAAEFYNESQIPYVYDAYENQPRLYEGKRGEGTGATQRIVVVDDLASIEVTDDGGNKASVGDRIKGLVGEARVESDPGVEASQNADVVRSVLNASPVGLDAEVTSINEDVVEKATGETIRRSGIRIFVPGRMDVPLVVPNSTESLASLLGILEVIASSTSVKSADLVDMLPEEAEMYNVEKVVGTPRSTSRGSGGAGAASKLYPTGG